MRLRGGYLRRLVAGGTFGLLMAHLLYFLNPQIAITPFRLAGVVFIYALIAAGIFGTALQLLHLLRVRWFAPQRHDRDRGFGFLALAAFISAVVYWGHVLLLRVYLPREAVRNLSKASTIVAAAALMVFVLWLLERTAPRRMTLMLFAAGCGIILLSSFFLYARRERYQIETAPASVPVAETRNPRRVILVAIRDLPFDWIVQLEGEDLLSFFSRAREQSFLTRLEPFPTTSPKTLWASLVTGKLPHAHGVTGRFSYRTLLNRRGQPFLLVPSWVGFKAWGLVPPVDRISAQLPAGDTLPLWRLVERFGRVAVINWPGTTRESLADTNTARQLLQSSANGQVTFVVASFSGLEALKLGANQLPPRSSRPGGQVRGILEQIDRLLGELDRITRDSTLVVFSPSGPRPPALPVTPLQLARNWLIQEDPGSSDGFLLIRDANAVTRENPAPAAITDVVPTALFAAGLPVGRDMDGRAVAEAFSESFVQQNPMSLIPTYETKRGGK